MFLVASSVPKYSHRDYISLNNGPGLSKLTLDRQTEYDLQVANCYAKVRCDLQVTTGA